MPRDDSKQSIHGGLKLFVQFERTPLESTAVHRAGLSFKPCLQPTRHNTNLDGGQRPVRGLQRNLAAS